MALEVETKFLDVDHDAIRQRLQGEGATFVACVFEDNQVWDTPAKTLRQRGQLLRLRQDRVCTLTFKDKAASEGPHKIAQEHETRVLDMAAMADILTSLGYGVAFRYQKLRETWQLGEVLCCLDLLPFGQFLELEGEQGAIAPVAGMLGLAVADGASETYHALHQRHCQRNALPMTDSFVFPPEQAQHLHNVAHQRRMACTTLP